MELTRRVHVAGRRLRLSVAVRQERFPLRLIREQLNAQYGMLSGTLIDANGVPRQVSERVRKVLMLARMSEMM